MAQKTVLITGGMGGVGRATARLFAQKGYRVAVLYHQTKPGDVAAFLRSIPGGSHAGVACDLKDYKKTRRAVNEINTDFGNIDACIHAATEPIIRRNVAQMTTDEFKQQFDVSVFGGFNVCKSVAEIMRTQQHGAIVAITSAVIEPGRTFGSMSGYVAAKFALRGLLRELARELLPYGVSVNAVAPGFMDTDLNADLPARVLEFLKDADGHGATPEEVAEVLLTTCSREGCEHSGSSFPVPRGEATLL